MITDPLSEYREKLRIYTAATEKAEEVVQRVSQGAKNLEHWRHVHVINTDWAFPAGAPERRVTIDGRTWPSGHELTAVLKVWHQAKRAVDSAWAALQPQDRQGVMPPP